MLEATFTAIFVPVLARAEQDDADGGAAFVRRLVTLATALLIVATALSVAAAPLLVRLMLGRTPEVNEPLTTAFAYLLLPQVLVYGLSSVFMAILNTRNVFGPPAWAPVVNNIVAIATLGVYLAVPGELSVDPVQMGNPKLLVLGIGTTLGVFAQTAVLLVAIGRERISLRPLWGIDERLKRFGTMAAAMVLYVLISQLGLVIGNQIASTAAASGPAIYNYTWLVLMLPFGMIGVTVLTVVMPRLSRNAAADDIPAVLADLSLATRLTMITLIPAVAFMTVGGPAMGSALFAYGHFGQVDAGYLGAAIALSAFTLIPYALVLLQLRVFYAREQPWTPIVVIVVITSVKVAGSIAAPHLTSNKQPGGRISGDRQRPGIPGRRGGRAPAAAAQPAPQGRPVDRPRRGAHHPGDHRGLPAGRPDRARRRPAAGDRPVDRPRRHRVAAAPGGAGGDHGADPGRGAARRAGPRGTRGPRRDPAPAGHPGSGAAPRSTTVSSGRAPVTYPEQRNAALPGDNAVREPIRREPPATRAGLAKGPEVTDRTPDSASSPAAPRRDRTGRGPTTSSPTSRPPRTGLRRASRSTGTPPKREPRCRSTPRERGPEPAPDDANLVPGARIANGRYRLLISHGGTPPLQFWQAMDTALHRQVALTFVDPEGALPEDVVQEILSRTLRLSRIDKPGIARILDVVHTGSGGLVVAEWIRGGSLQEVADTSPSPVGAIRAMQSLAAAADAAHRAGVALSIDHPSRVRLSIDGDVVLAFPATMPDANPQDDIRGIGASLYALLVNRWPLPETGARSGLAPAERDANGQAVEPTVVDRDIPFQISAVAVRSVQEDGGIRSASTLLNLLQQATAVADRTEVLSPIAEPPAPASPRRSTGRGDETYSRRRRNLLIGLGAGAIVLVVALVVLASVVSKIFGDVGNGLKGEQPGLNNNPPSSATETPGPTAPSGSTVKPTKVTVFSPGGDADNPGDAANAIDGNPATSWQTDTYTDPVPFPGFKSGVGLLLQLPKPTVVGAVTIDISSTGTKVEIRSSSSPNPSRLEDTTVLTPATALKAGHNTIAVKASAPTSNLLVWISTLGTTDGKSRADISEITIQAAS